MINVARKHALETDKDIFGIRIIPPRKKTLFLDWCFTAWLITKSGQGTSPARLILECGGKLSATPLWILFSVILTKLTERRRASLCRRTPNLSRERLSQHP